MEFKEVNARRRSVRKFDTARMVEGDKIERLLAAALAAPSSRNSRSTRLAVVDDRATIDRMAAMRDYGAAFLTGAPLAIVVAGDRTASDLWEVNASIAATILQLTAVDEGLASCWVHVAGRPRLKDDPEGETAADYLRGLLPLGEGWEPLCVVALGYSDYVPKPLPEADDTARVVWAGR